MAAEIKKRIIVIEKGLPAGNPFSMTVTCMFFLNAYFAFIFKENIRSHF